MNQKIFQLIASLLLAAVIAASAQNTQRPKIGLALSGGGAKGLAHIGILKAIDSAGLSIDYITGTSMGSIIGSLYAIGYPADSIEKMARAINWDLLLSNQASLRTLFMEEKEEYSRYTVELPWVNHGFQLPTGVLQGQELWLKLSEMLYPVYNQKDFSKFNIPFKCIGTDVGNGEAVVLDKGEITNAIRSSMAIPSFFTAVDYDGKKLVDGGVVRNFPVRDVKEMGADFVIGSNVAGGLLPSDKVRNAIQVLLQVAFFREAQDHKQEVKLCDIYIPFNMQQYNMGSFSQADDILELGIKEGKRLYPVFKHLADSLNEKYGYKPFHANRLPASAAVTISAFEVHGLKNTDADFFAHTMDLLLNKSYTPEQLSRMVRAAFGTRYYSRVTYSLQPLPDTTCRIVFDVTENPLTFAKLSLHYNKFTGISLIANLTARNFLITNSRDLVTVNIGEALRIRAEHLQYIGRRKNFSLSLGAQADRFDINTYNTYKQNGIYKQNLAKLDGHLQYSTLRNLAVGIGERFETISYKPAILSGFQFTGNNNFFTTYTFVSHNSLDKVVYPRKGVKLRAELGFVAQQDPNISFFVNGQEAPKDSIQVSGKPYPRLTFTLDNFTPLSRRSVLGLKIQAGANFNYGRNIMNEFAVGGMTSLFRNQVVFAGLQEGSLYTPAFAAFMATYRYELLSNTYVCGTANFLVNNTVTTSPFFQNPNLLSGYALTFGYNFALGPLEFSLMYSGQSKNLGTYVNIGIPF
ncbi:MAG: patatin-like phospholipase family protein [Bacteroidota bacterium]|nr:patatin-like phospholipase family protein [Bacteroidota bacterium]